MKWWMALLLILWLIILSDGTAAFFAGMKCYQRRKQAGPVALAMALVLFTLTVESLNQIANQAIHAELLKFPLSYIIQQSIGRGLKSAAYVVFSMAVNERLI